MAEWNNFFLDSLFRVQGALLGHIRPECLLDVAEFKQWCSIQVQTFTHHTQWSSVDLLKIHIPYEFLEHLYQIKSAFLRVEIFFALPLISLVSSHRIYFDALYFSCRPMRESTVWITAVLTMNLLANDPGLMCCCRYSRWKTPSYPL